MNPNENESINTNEKHTEEENSVGAFRLSDWAQKYFGACSLYACWGKIIYLWWCCSQKEQIYWCVLRDAVCDLWSSFQGNIDPTLSVETVSLVSWL